MTRTLLVPENVISLQFMERWPTARSWTVTWIWTWVSGQHTALADRQCYHRFPGVCCRQWLIISVDLHPPAQLRPKRFYFFVSTSTVQANEQRDNRVWWHTATAFHENMLLLQTSHCTSSFNEITISTYAFGRRPQASQRCTSSNVMQYVQCISMWSFFLQNPLLMLDQELRFSVISISKYV